MTSGHIRTRSAAVFRHAVRALVAVALTGSTLSAQQRGAGRITGRIIDAATGAGIPDAGVQIVGTTSGTASGVDGRYSISNVPAGTVTLQVRRIGFAPKSVTGLLLDAGRTLEQDVTLESAALRLTAQVVTAIAERGTVNDALDRQRTATQLVNSVTAEQIARSPDSDAGQAVQRVSGVTVQDGKYVFVRGLGERYTTTSLNGARLPSPEPERKVVPLDLFPTGLLQSITTTKTFTPDQPGDFSGASVDIRTREFPAQRQFTYSATAGYNTTAGGNALPRTRGVGGERFALSGNARDLPTELDEAGNLRRSSPDDVNRYINSFRNVWRPGTGIGTPNGSASAALGGNDPIFGQRVGYLLSGTYSTTQEVRRTEVRALALEDTRSIDRFVGTSGRASVLWGGLFNASTLIGSHSRLLLNNTYNRTADDDARIEVGTLDRLGGARARIERLDYIERSIRSSQLAGEHELGRSKFDWAATASGVTRDQPDRSESVYELVADPATGVERALFANSDGEGAVRTFGALTENSYEGRANYEIRVGSDSRPQTIKVGALYRATSRESDTRSFGILAGAFSDADRALQPEQIFDGRFSQPGQRVLQLRVLGQGGAYRANDDLAASYAMGDLGFSDRIRFIGGARIERSAVEVISDAILSDQPNVARPTYTDVLPSAAINVKVSDAQNVRFSVSRTLARPEYRELSDITTREVIGGDFLRGNSALERTLIDNADLRWEIYPNPGELVSVGLFAKRFDRPIERTYQSTSNNPVITFVNADAAENYGIEFEARKSLGFVHERLASFTTFSNVTLMQSEIRLGGSQAASTNANRRMAGQAPYVVNAGLTYTSATGATSATALFNRVGERIHAAGASPLADVIERPRNGLDLSIRFPIAGALSGRADARNVLDARSETTQGTVVRSAFNTGRVIQAGVSWRP